MSCSEGCASSNDRSAQPCGCDKGANWLCERHRTVHDVLRAAFAEGVSMAREDAVSLSTDDEDIEHYWQQSETRASAFSSHR